MSEIGKKDIFYIVITAIIFSAMEVVLKIAGTDLDPFQLTFVRFVVGGLFLLPFALKEMKRNGVNLSRGDYLYLFFLGIICICISMSFFQMSLIWANANLVSVLFCTNSVFTMIFAHFIVNDHFTKRKAFILTISVFGMLIVANPFHLSEGNTLTGIIYAVAASAAFGLYSAAGKLRIHKIGDLAQSSLSFLFGSAVMLLFMLFMDKPVIAGIGSHNILLVLFISLLTGMGYYYYFKAIHTCGPSNAALVFFLKPMFAPVIAFLVLQEPITWNIILGIVFILTGSYINISGQKKHQKEKSAT